LIVTSKIAARIAAIILVGVLLQLAFFSRVSVLGTSPDITPAIVLCMGLLGGSLVGASTGFSTGLVIDTLQYQTLGASSLALLLVGYIAGRYREAFDVSYRLTPPLLAGGLTVLAVLAFSMIQLMLGVEAELSGLVVKDTLLKALYNMVLVIPIYAAMRRILAPALVDEGPPRPSALATAMRTVR
jgi:rod shape-determining protein MreD